MERSCKSRIGDRHSSLVVTRNADISVSQIESLVLTENSYNITVGFIRTNPVKVIPLKGRSYSTKTERSGMMIQ
jgi:hypothetical protein